MRRFEKLIVFLFLCVLTAGIICGAIHFCNSLSNKVADRQKQIEEDIGLGYSPPPISKKSE